MCRRESADKYRGISNVVVFKMFILGEHCWTLQERVPQFLSFPVGRLYFLPKYRSYWKIKFSVAEHNLKGSLVPIVILFLNGQQHPLILFRLAFHCHLLRLGEEWVGRLIHNWNWPIWAKLACHHSVIIMITATSMKAGRHTTSNYFWTISWFG